MARLPIRRLLYTLEEREKFPVPTGQERGPLRIQGYPLKSLSGLEHSFLNFSALNKQPIQSLGPFHTNIPQCHGQLAGNASSECAWQQGTFLAAWVSSVAQTELTAGDLMQPFHRAGFIG